MKRLLIVQYAGDYREAWRRLQATGTESYYGHRYVLDRLAHLAREFGDAGVLCCRAPERYVERLPNGVMTMGANRKPGLQSRAILRTVADYDPTHLVVHGPMPHILRWGVRAGIRTVGMFADSFDTQPVKRFIKHGMIDRQLNGDGVDWVGNHGINACLSLARRGVDRRKIVPWDWPHDHGPDEYPAKTLDTGSIEGGHAATLFYVGHISQAKGVGDAIGAVAVLKKRGRTIRLHIAGGGQVEQFRKMADDLDVGAEVAFLGPVPNGEVLARMREATLVLVPSRHAFPEGLPLTIYEALRSRTPIVASDHPMFAHNLVDGESALVFAAGHAPAMADRIARLLDDAALYATLSAGGARAWNRIQIAGKWGDILEHWMRDAPADRAWLAQHRLDAGLYADQLQGR